MSNFTTATSTLLASVTSFLALTTPFVQPSGCKHGYMTVTETNSTYENVYLVSDSASADYTSCQPPQYRPENSHSYSPAVCPESWVAVNMAASLSLATEVSASYTIYPYRGYSSAHCCMRNYELVSTTTGPLVSLGPLCVESYSEATSDSTLPTSDGAAEATTTSSVRSRGVHPAMWIAWESDDVSTLSPPPPSLTSNMLIPTWTPGMQIPKGKYDNFGRGGPSQTEGEFQANGMRTTALAVAIPVALIVLIVTSCCYCCCASKKKKKKKRIVAGTPDLVTEETVGQLPIHREEEQMNPPPKYSPRDGEYPTSGIPLTTVRVDRI